MIKAIVMAKAFFQAFLSWKKEMIGKKTEGTNDSRLLRRIAGKPAISVSERELKFVIPGSLKDSPFKFFNTDLIGEEIDLKDSDFKDSPFLRSKDCPFGGVQFITRS